jgi:uncharacterized protein (TIGR02598 family)
MKTHCRAFTLIESLLAICIAATVLMTLLALLPAGLDATREAAQRSAVARIFARLKQQCTVSALNGDFYFDAQGRLLTSRTVDAVFAARVLPATTVAIPGDASTTLRSISITLSDLMLDDPFADPQHLRVQRLLLAPLTNGGSS